MLLIGSTFSVPLTWVWLLLGFGLIGFAFGLGMLAASVKNDAQ